MFEFLVSTAETFFLHLRLTISGAVCQIQFLQEQAQLSPPEFIRFALPEWSSVFPQQFPAGLSPATFPGGQRGQSLSLPESANLIWHRHASSDQRLAKLQQAAFGADFSCWHMYGGQFPQAVQPGEFECIIPVRFAFDAAPLPGLAAGIGDETFLIEFFT